MSLNEINLRSLTLKQYLFKLKGYSGLVYGLIITQIVALLFSLGPNGSVGSGTDGLSVSVKTYSANIIIFFSFAWIIVIAGSLTTKQYKDMEFSLVANRISSNLSNIGFLITCAVWAGISSTLMGVLQRMIMYFTLDRAMFMRDGFLTVPADLLLGAFVTSLYLILLAASGYLIRVIIEVHKVFVILIPAVLIGLLRSYTDSLIAIFNFFTSEHLLLFFTLKILSASIILFGMSILLSNRMEVRQ
ncbi:hypothetical protein JCM15765_09810 [Paradesulfitobacterium aromaticivorans]